MEKKALIELFVNMADHYDRIEDSEKADALDQAIKIMAELEGDEIDVEVPEDEMDMLQNVFESLKKSLQ